MADKQTTYRVIRYVPDRMRGESVNIGLAMKVLATDEWIIRFTSNWRRLRSLQPDANEAAYNEMVYWLLAERALEARSADLESLESRIAEIPPVQLSSERLVGLRDGLEWWTFDQISQQLIDAPKSGRNMTGGQKSRLDTSLKNWLKSEDILAKDETEMAHKFVSGYVSPGLVAPVDFAARNGTLHLVETLDLRGKSSSLKNKKSGEAAMAAINLERARIKLDGNVRRYFIYFADDSEISRELEDRCLDIVDGNVDASYNYGSDSGKKEAQDALLTVASSE